MNLRRFPFLLALIVLGPLSFGQHFRYLYYEGDDVPFSKVNQTIQDTKGYVWMATDQGLYRYNGNEFEDFNTHLRSKYIKAFAQWSADTLLFSNDLGLYKLFYDKQTVAITPFILKGSTRTGLDYPGKLFKDSKNRIWVGQLDGSVYLRDGRIANKFKLAKSNPSKTPRIYFGEDQFNTVWMLVPQGGLFYYDERSRSVKEFGQYRNSEHFYVEDDNLLLGGDGLSRLTVNEAQKLVSKTQLILQGREISYITKDLSGLYFINTDDGLYTLRTTGENRSAKRVFGANDTHRIDELPFRFINHLYFTPDKIRPGGVVWVSTSDGLGILSSSFFQGVSGIPNDNIFSLGTTSGNEVLVSQGNVNIIHQLNGHMDYKRIDGLERVISISSYNNNIWYGTADGLIFSYSSQKLLKRYDLAKNGGGVFNMFADQEGNNWYCQAPTESPVVGLSKLTKEGKNVVYNEAKGLNTRILAIDESERNELYVAGIGAEHYLFQYDRDSDRFFNRSLPFPFKASANFEVHDIAVDSEGVVWMGTTDGLLKYDTEHVQRIDLGSYTRDEVRAVCVMQGKGIWLATDIDGLIYLDKTGNFVLFDETCGTPSKVSSYRSMVMDDMQRLWVGTAEGLVYSSLPNPKPLVTTSPVLKQWQVNGKSQKKTKSVSFVAPDDVSLEFNTLVFPGDNVQYRYKIYRTDVPNDEIIEVPWSAPTTDKHIRLQDSRAGIYQLLIASKKQGGYAWSKPLSLSVQVENRWYQTRAGIAILSVAGLLFFWYYIRLWVLRRTKRLRASLNKKEEELSEKEAQLKQQANTLVHQEKALKTAGANVHLLNRLLNQMPKNVPWKELFPTLLKLVELPTGIDAIELAYKAKGEVVYKGFERGIGKLKKRQTEFNEKSNLVSYALATETSLHINDFEKEAGKYIGEVASDYASGLWIPFHQKNGSGAVLCIYAFEKEKFERRDLALLEILAAFLSLNATSELV